MTLPSLNKSIFVEAVRTIRDAQRIVVFTGAGISVASGVETFRNKDGLWTRFPPEDFANWQGLLQTAILQPKRLADFLIALLKPIAEATPNAGHLALASLEDGKAVEIVTQNIDQLHQRAGSTHVHEIHGNLFKIISFPAKKPIAALSKEDLQKIVDDLQQAQQEFWGGLQLLRAIRPLLSLDLHGMHRPNLVLFGDQLAEPAWTNAQFAVEDCDLLITIGTSLTTEPAARLPMIAKRHGARIIVVDPDPVVGLGPGSLCLHDRAGDVLPELIAAACDSETKSKQDD